MNYGQAISYAREITYLLLRGAGQIARKSIREQSLMGGLSVMIAAQNHDIDALDPTIQEIVLFGSTARGDSTPGDIDLMMFDKGFYSNALSFEPNEATRSPRKSDWYGSLKENLPLVLEGWFGFRPDDPEMKSIEEPLVDLHVLPIAVFTDPIRRREIAAKHSDPRFFQNAFSSMRRFDPVTRDFIPAGLEYFEGKYGVDLSDLR